jgi:membrane-bound lytic murein transglycosylase A
MTHTMRSLLGTAIIAGFLAGCTAVPPQPPPPARPADPVAERPQPPLRATAPAALPGWRSDPLDGLGAALARQCAMAAPPGPWPRLCDELRTLPPDALRDWIESRFDAWTLRDERGERGDEGLVTGYYEPLLTGSRRRESASQVPLYLRPPDLLAIDLGAVEPRVAGLRLRGRLNGHRVVPYYDRAEVETGGRLSGQELLWVDDPVDAFFLEIQGSGRVRLRDGTELRIGYADQNGHPYRAIGRTLVERGALAQDEVTAQSIKRWLRENPRQAADVMRTNPSMVFFRELPPAPAAAPGAPPAGPPGSLGVALTPMRSLAVDRSRVPLGSLVFLETTHPLDGSAIRRVMAAQDTGGAIVGTVRADYFWGFGPDAEAAAGAMRSTGRMWLLWPKGEVPPTLARRR